MNFDTQEPDCAVCLQQCHHPTQLPCGHIFCFLCVKGIAFQSKKCAMCRAAIPHDYLDHPVLLEKLTPQQSTDSNEEYQWYYEGRNGWWKYDERSNAELETSFNEGGTECILLLAGALYTIDFQNMMQVRNSDASRRRHVRRDRATLPAKGIAGIKNLGNKQTESSKDVSNENNSNDITTDHPIQDGIIEIIDEVVDLAQVEDTETDQLNLPESHDTSDLIQQFSTINLSESASPTHDSTAEDT